MKGTAKRPLPPPGRAQRADKVDPVVEHHFFELIPPNLNIDFVGMRFKMLILSWAVILIGLGSIWYRGGSTTGSISSAARWCR